MTGSSAANRVCGWPFVTTRANFLAALAPRLSTTGIELFYFLDPAAAGHGYATEAMRGFIGFLFDQFDQDALYADVFTDNPGSEHVLCKLGFDRTGAGMGVSAARLEPFPVSHYRLTQHQFRAAEQ